MRPWLIIPLFTIVYGSSKRRHTSPSSSTSSTTPTPVVSTYTVATLVPISQSQYNPYMDSQSLNEGGLEPVTVTQTSLVPIFSTVTATQSVTVTASITGKGKHSPKSTDNSDGDGSDGGNDSSDASDSDDSSPPKILTSFSTSIYIPQFTSSKKHRF